MDRLDKHSQIRALRLFAAGAIVIACREPASEPRSETAPTETAPSCDTRDVRQVVERFGERLKQVPLLAPDSIVEREIREVYGSLVTPSLLDTWIAEPAGAPGRQVSSPWPERIEVDSMGPAGAGICRVVGEVVYVTSEEAMEGGAAYRERVDLRLSRDGGWRISAYDVVAPPMSDSTSASEEAAEVLRRYYAAINARDFRRAYELWGDDGAASRQEFEEFAAGFAETVRVEIEIGKPGRVEPAAGSRYVEVPVQVRAVTASGEEQEFEGTYTLRRSVVDGASAEQRQWHIYSAAIAPVR